MWIRTELGDLVEAKGSIGIPTNVAMGEFYVIMNQDQGSAEMNEDSIELAHEELGSTLEEMDLVLAIAEWLDKSTHGVFDIPKWLEDRE
jgi:hypothetical protein